MNTSNARNAVTSQLLWAFMFAGPVRPGAAQSPCMSTPVCSIAPSDAIGPTGAGNRLAISGDGTRIVIGAFGHGHGGVPSGAAWVISNPGSATQSEAELLPSNAFASMKFSYALAMNTDGNALIVGAPAFGTGWPGNAYVFRYNGVAWTEEWRQGGINTPNVDSFGNAVAIDATGDVIAVGAPSRSLNLINDHIGAVEVYRRGASGWLHEATLLPAEALVSANLFFGSYAAISADGSVLAVRSGSTSGAPQPNGAIYMFEHGASGWMQVAKLQEPVAYSLGGFGTALAIDAAGQTLLVGNFDDSRLVAYGQGAATIFRKGSTGWSYDDVLLPSIPVPNGSFGFSVAINGAGDRVVVGEPGAYYAGTLSCGSTSVFEYTNGNWVLAELSYAPTPTGTSAFGRSVRCSATGRLWLSAEPTADYTGTDSGLVHVFETPCLSAKAFCTAKTNSLGCVPQIGAQGTPSCSSPSGFTVSAANLRNQQNGLLFYGTNGRSALPWKGGTLCVAPPLRRLPLQNAAGSPLPTTDCSGALAVDFNTWTSAHVDPALFAGQHVRAQFYCRDPAATYHVNLTDAVEFYLEL